MPGLSESQIIGLSETTLEHISWSYDADPNPVDSQRWSNEGIFNAVVSHLLSMPVQNQVEQANLLDQLK